MKRLVILAIGCGLGLGTMAADGGIDLKSDADRIGYSLGYQIGGDFRRQKVDLAPAAVVRGIADGRSDAKPQLTPQEMNAILVDLKRKVEPQEPGTVSVTQAEPPPKAEAAEPAAASPESSVPGSAARHQAPRASRAAKAFFTSNARQAGVVTQPSGLQYRVLKDGSGRQPTASDSVSLVYRGTLVNGNEFGNTYKAGKPAPKSFAVADLVAGLREAVLQMKEGAHWQVFIPPELGFDSATPLYKKVTIFDVELVSVNSK